MYMHKHMHKHMKSEIFWQKKHPIRLRNSIPISDDKPGPANPVFIICKIYMLRVI